MDSLSSSFTPFSGKRPSEDEGQGAKRVARGYTLHDIARLSPDDFRSKAKMWLPRILDEMKATLPTLHPSETQHLQQDLHAIEHQLSTGRFDSELLKSIKDINKTLKGAIPEQMPHLPDKPAQALTFTKELVDQAWTNGHIRLDSEGRLTLSLGLLSNLSDKGLEELLQNTDKEKLAKIKHFDLVGTVLTPGIIAKYCPNIDKSSFGYLRGSKPLRDHTLVVGGTSIPVNKALVGHYCPVLAAMWRSPMQESRQESSDLQGVSPVALRSCMNYIVGAYDLEKQKSLDHVAAVLLCAIYLGFDPLADAAGIRISELVASKNVTAADLLPLFADLQPYAKMLPETIKALDQVTAKTLASVRESDQEELTFEKVEQFKAVCKAIKPYLPLLPQALKELEASALALAERLDRGQMRKPAFERASSFINFLWSLELPVKYEQLNTATTEEKLSQELEMYGESKVPPTPAQLSELVERMSKLIPENLDVHYFAGRAAFEAGAFDKAKEHLEMAHKGKKPQAAQALAELYIQGPEGVRDLARARKLLEELIATPPIHFSIYISLAHLELSEGHPDNALALLSRFEQPQDALVQAVGGMEGVLSIRCYLAYLLSSNQPGINIDRDRATQIMQGNDLKDMGRDRFALSYGVAYYLLNKKEFLGRYAREYAQDTILRHVIFPEKRYLDELKLAVASEIPAESESDRESESGSESEPMSDA